MNGLRSDSAMTDTTNRSPNAIALTGLGDHFSASYIAHVRVFARWLSAAATDFMLLA